MIHNLRYFQFTSLIFLLLFFGCGKQNPFSPQSPHYTFYQTWGKDYYGTSRDIGPGHGDGTSGSSIGAYNTPTKIVKYDNFLFILDKDNHRIQKFSLTGTPIDFQNQTPSYINMNSLGEKGTGTGEFLNLSDLKIDTEGRLYIADSENFTVQIFDKNGTNITNLGTSYSNGPEGFVQPALLAVDNSTNLYIIDTFKQTIDQYKNFHYVSSSVYSELKNAVDFEYYNSFLYVLLPNKILKFSTSGHLTDTFNLGGYQLNRLSCAEGFFIQKEQFFITDGSYIKIFDNTFQLLYTLGGLSGKRTGEFQSPSDLLIEGSYLYITDSGNNRIQVYKLQDD